MSSRDTRIARIHMDLRQELNNFVEHCRKIGIKDVSFKDASEFYAKNRKYYTNEEIKNFFRIKRGLT